MDKRGTGRRTVLQRGLALLAGGVAVATGGRAVRAEQPIAPKTEPDPQRGPVTLTLYARKRPLAALPGTSRGYGEDPRAVTSGELLTAVDGQAIGAFHTNCFCMGAPHGPHTRDSSSLEFQVLEFKDGTLFGLGGGAFASGTKAHAIVGGTGAFAGARGSYVERPVAENATGRDIVELIITVVS